MKKLLDIAAKVIDLVTRYLFIVVLIDISLK